MHPFNDNDVDNTEDDDDGGVFFDASGSPRLAPGPQPAPVSSPPSSPLLLTER